MKTIFICVGLSILSCALYKYLEYRIKTDFETHLKGGFSWKDCGSSSAAVSIQSLSLGPDPLEFPGPVNVASEFRVKNPLNAPLKGVVNVYLYVWPVYWNVKTYHFDDMCENPYKNKCPEELKKIGIDCSCPIKANTYNLKEMQLEAPAVKIRSGYFKINAEVFMSGKQAVCLDVYFTVA